MKKALFLVTGIAMLGACSDDEERCEDPKYGNGTCDVATSCAEPDIDCFTTFETQAEAQAWYSSSPVAELRPPIAATDARFARMQELIDQGWEAYKSVNPVGDLGKKKVHLVLANDPGGPNAFVISKDEHAGLAVMVTPALIDLGVPDDQIMGVVMHELEHVIGMHVLSQVQTGFNKYYLAPTGSEPLGFQQTDNAMVRALVEEWVDLALPGGYLADVELSGLPFAGRLQEIFDQRLSMQPSTPGCTTAKSTLGTIRNMIINAISPIDDGITLNATAPTTILNAMNAIQAQCFAGFTPDVFDVVAAFFNVTRAQALTLASADLRPLIEGQTFVQGMFTWSSYLRTKMREVEARFQQMTGQPWTRARFYSTEEAADDSSVPVLRAMGLAPDGAGQIFLKLAPGVEAPCRPLVNGNLPIPYGERLDDDHHALCWRAGHIKAIVGIDQPRTVAPMVLHARPRTMFSPPPKTYSH